MDLTVESCSAYGGRARKRLLQFDRSPIMIIAEQGVPEPDKAIAENTLRKRHTPYVMGAANALLPVGYTIGSSEPSASSGV